MKSFLFFLLFPALSFSQIGIKGGLNFSNVTKASQINSKSSTGFHAGIFLAPKTKSVLGFRSELIFSRQGYDYKNGTTTGAVDLDYLLLPQLLEINITKYVALHVGGQMAFLLNAKDDASNNTGNAQVDKIIDFMNRFDYGAAGGVEVHPVKGLLLGARMNVSFSKVFKEIDPASSFRPSFYAEAAKNNVIQVFAGYRF